MANVAPSTVRCLTHHVVFPWKDPCPVGGGRLPAATQHASRDQVPRVTTASPILLTLDGAILQMLDELHPAYGATLEERALFLLRRQLVGLLEDEVPVFRIPPSDD